MSKERGSISEVIGGVPIMNSYFSGDLSKMTDDQLRARLEELANADANDDECDEAFENRQMEMEAIRLELQQRMQR